MSRNAKYYIKSFKINKVKSSDIRGLWKKKYSEEKIVSIHWQILQLLILPVSVRQKRQCYRSRQTNCFFSLYYIAQLNTVFLKFVLVKRKFAWIAKKLTSIGSFKAMISWFCLAVAHTSIFDPPCQTFLL